MSNPFQAMADAGLRKHAAVLAQAFVHSSTGMAGAQETVSFARSRERLPPGDYLRGLYFHGWIDLYTGEPHDFGALQDAAGVYAQHAGETA